MLLPAAERQHDSALTSWTTRAAALAEFLAWMLCVVCLAGGGATAGVEPPIAESRAEVSETACDNDDTDDQTASHRADHRAKGKMRPFWTRTSADTAVATSVVPGTLAVVRSQPGAEPALLLAKALRQGSQACTAELLLASVPTRGPTTLS